MVHFDKMLALDRGTALQVHWSKIATQSKFEPDLAKSSFLYLFSESNHPPKSASQCFYYISWSPLDIVELRI